MDSDPGSRQSRINRFKGNLDETKRRPRKASSLDRNLPNNQAHSSTDSPHSSNQPPPSSNSSQSVDLTESGLASVGTDSSSDYLTASIGSNCSRQNPVPPSLIQLSEESPVKEVKEAQRASLVTATVEPSTALPHFNRHSSPVLQQFGSVTPPVQTKMDPHQFSTFMANLTAAVSERARDDKPTAMFNGTSPFSTFITQVENLHNINDLASDAVKIQKVLSCMEPRIRYWLSGQDEHNKLHGDYSAAKAWMLTKFPGRRTEQMSKAALEGVSQKHDESSLEYYERKTQLYFDQNLPLDLDYCRSMAKGIRDRRARSEILKSINMPRFETSDIEALIVACTTDYGDNPGSFSGNRASSGSDWKGRNDFKPRSTSPFRGSDRGRSPSPGRPPITSSNRPGNCKKCGKPGHWAFECTSRSVTFGFGESTLCAMCCEEQSDPNRCNHFASGHSASFGQASARPQSFGQAAAEPKLASLESKMDLLARELQTLRMSTSNPVTINFPDPGNDHRRFDMGQPPTGSQTQHK